MQEVKDQIILSKDEYQLMLSYVKGNLSMNAFDRHNAEELESELKKARLIDKVHFPEDVVRLNSKVKVKDEKDGRIFEITLVTPQRADIKQRKVSIMSPVGTALIGYRKGHKVHWKVPSGDKTFTILEVSNLL